MLTSTHWPTSSGEVGRIDIERDASGNAVRETWYDPQGNLSSYDINQYDAAGYQIRTEQYDSQGELSGPWNTKTMNRARISKRSYYERTGSCTTITLRNTIQTAGGSVKTITGRMGSWNIIVSINMTRKEIISEVNGMTARKSGKL